MKKYICIILALLAVSLYGCTGDKTEELNTRDFIAMDTVFTLRTGNIAVNSGSSSDIENIFDECEDLTGELEQALSATLDGAETHSFNAEVNAMFDVDSTFTEVLTVALQISELTDGAYEPVIGNLTSLWNIKGGGPVPTEDQIKGALALTGSSLIEIKDDGIYKSDSSVKLDFGGIGKGYAAQKLAEHLFESGVSYGIISAGRTVGVFGDKPDGTPFKVGIANPDDTESVVGYLYAESGFISVAGDYEQFFEADGVRYHHIIDPETGYPSASGLSSVAVLSQNGAAADALSTALMVMGYDRGMELYSSGTIPFEAVFIASDGTVMLTDGLTEDRFEMSETYVPIGTEAKTVTVSSSDLPDTTATDTDTEIIETTAN